MITFLKVCIQFILVSMQSDRTKLIFYLADDIPTLVNIFRIPLTNERIINISFTDI